MFPCNMQGFMISLIGIWSLFCAAACSNVDTQRVDKLNEKAYEYHYRSLDSTRKYAQAALALSGNYADGRAEALNHLAFVSMAHMDYQEVRSLIGNLDEITDNQVELLVADVQMMRLCQRKSDNKEFYTYRERALRRIHRIEEESNLLNAHQKHRFSYAYTEFYIVASVYFYYVGLTHEAHDELSHLSGSDYLEQDTAQLLNYLYNVGSGGIVQSPSAAEVHQTEFERLLQCYLLARQQQNFFFEAQALQGLSEHLLDEDVRNKLITDNLPAIRYVNVDNMPDTLLAGNFAQRALDLFTRYGDVYQTAGSYRTLAECYWKLHDYHSSLICLQNALLTDTVIQRAPDLVASIREQMSLTYSAIDDKPNSDYNRNIYLDMQEKTRQDRQLEARAEQLGHSSQMLNVMIGAIVFVLLFFATLLVILYRKRRSTDGDISVEDLLHPLRKWKEINDERMAELDEESLEMRERIELEQLHLVRSRQRNLEQRAKLSLVTSITPFIDRILHEVVMLRHDESAPISNERMTYIAELSDKINEYNVVLTDWIRMRQGELNLSIESFPLQSLFEIVAKSKMGFLLKGITLQVLPTDIVVKADKTLTLFMINTLADNARKFTPTGGRVTISAERHDGYAEIVIIDTGVGMTDKQLEHLFDHKPIIDNADGLQDGKSHGFGLMNCKGIIEKYKKISQLFAPCAIGAESGGHGSRFWFRLPLGVVRVVVALMMLVGSQIALAESLPTLSQQYADSAYHCNVVGDYHRALLMADSCLLNLNADYASAHPSASRRKAMLLYDASGADAAELAWFRQGVYADYTTILNVRNEVAVAALALHLWDLYNYNNKAYTQLFRERSADQSLDNYVRVMQKSETNKNVAVIILVILLLLLFPAYYVFYYRYRLMYRFCIDRIRQINEVLLGEGRASDKLVQVNAIWAPRHLSFDGRFQSLDSLVGQICTALQQQINYDKEQRDIIEQERDELSRRQYETAQLHINNSVLDNCLSTLKHETMYYPSRIRQIVDVKPLDCDALAEVAGYYKALYSILSEQALRQTDAPMRIDDTMWTMLIDVLGNLNGCKVAWRVETRDAHYLSVTIPMPHVALTEEQCRQLFTPSTVDVRYLLCRQIIRELGEGTHARACGINATLADAGIEVHLTVPCSINFFKENKPIKQ